MTKILNWQDGDFTRLIIIVYDITYVNNTIRNNEHY